MTIDYGIGDFVNQTTRFDGSTVSNEYDQAGRLAIARISNSEQGTPQSTIQYPLGISGGLNLYEFCSNNPVNFIDPDGRSGYFIAKLLEVITAFSGQASEDSSHVFIRYE